MLTESPFISCTSMRTSPIIERTEELIGKPVVTANQATAWEALRLAGLFSERPSLIPSQKGLFEMSPGVRRWSGAEEATGCRLLASPPYLLRSGQA